MPGLVTQATAKSVPPIQEGPASTAKNAATIQIGA
jgi:hypothetical protein